VESQGCSSRGIDDCSSIEAVRVPLSNRDRVSPYRGEEPGCGRGQWRGAYQRAPAERAFLQLGPVAEDFLRAAAAAAANKLPSELAGIAKLAAAWGRDQVVAAFERAPMFRRFTGPSR
jgi:hypothetical protein